MKDSHKSPCKLDLTFVRVQDYRYNNICRRISCLNRCNSAQKCFHIPPLPGACACALIPLPGPNFSRFRLSAMLHMRKILAWGQGYCSVWVALFLGVSWKSKKLSKDLLYNQADIGMTQLLANKVHIIASWQSAQHNVIATFHTTTLHKLQWYGNYSFLLLLM